MLGHCTGRLVTGNRGMRKQSEFDAEAGLRRPALETRHGRRDQLAAPSAATRPTSCSQLAIDMGCLFSIDSDAHAPGQLDFQAYGCARAEELGLDPERIVNTWPVDRLLDVGRARYDLLGRDRRTVGRRAIFLRMSPEVEVRRSRRRTRTVSAYRRDGKVIVMIPDRFTRAEEAEWVATMLDRLEQSEQRRRRTDDAAERRARELCRDYLHGKVEPDVGALGRQHDHPLGVVHDRRPADPALRPAAGDAGLGGRLRAAARAGAPDRAEPQQARSGTGSTATRRPSGPRATSRASPTRPTLDLEPALTSD